MCLTYPEAWFDSRIVTDFPDCWKLNTKLERILTKNHTTKQWPKTNPSTHNGSNNKQWINNKTTALEWAAAKATGGISGLGLDLF